MEESKEAPATASATSTSGGTTASTKRGDATMSTGVAAPTSTGDAETLEEVKTLRANVDALAAERKRLRQELKKQQHAMDSAKKAHQDVMRGHGVVMSAEELEKVLADAKVEHADLEASTLGPDAPLRKYLTASASHAKAEVDLRMAQARLEDADDKLGDATRSGGLEYLQEKIREHSGGWQRIEGHGVTGALAYDKACQLEGRLDTMESTFKGQFDTLKGQLDTVMGSVADLKDMLAPISAEIKLMREARESARKSWDFPGSTMVTGGRVPAANLAKLKAWVQDVKPAATKLRLLYRRSRDGAAAADFHRRCDGKGATVVLCHDAATGCVFGGFLSVSWASAGGWTHAAGSFLFRLAGRDRAKPAERTPKIVKEGNAVFLKHDHGPYFGDGGEFALNEVDPSTRMAGCSLNTLSSPTYELPAGHATTAEFLNDTNTTTHNPALADVEVWAVE